MFANIVLATLVTSVITIVALGHVLLVVALWPDPKGRRIPHLNTVDDGTPLIH